MFDTGMITADWGMSEIDEHCRDIPKRRKMKDEFQIHGYYAGGWEEVTADETRKDALVNLRLYRENERGTSFKLIVKRVPQTP